MYFMHLSVGRNYNNYIRQPPITLRLQPAHKARVSVEDITTSVSI